MRADRWHRNIGIQTDRDCLILLYSLDPEQNVKHVTLVYIARITWMRKGDEEFLSA